MILWRDEKKSGVSCPSCARAGEAKINRKGNLNAAKVANACSGVRESLHKCFGSGINR
jgi:hypothetical protein